ncbi:MULTISPECIES: hypothetical protein [Francisella]|nr:MULTISPECIES: hypothetical protein [Francisella]
MNSVLGTRFRKWAAQTLKQHIIKAIRLIRLKLRKILIS